MNFRFRILLEAISGFILCVALQMYFPVENMGILAFMFLSILLIHDLFIPVIYPKRGVRK